MAALAAQGIRTGAARLEASFDEMMGHYGLQRNVPPYQPVEGGS